MNTTNTIRHPVDVTSASFETEVVARSHQHPVLVDFWAAWCGPCKMIAPSLKEIALERGEQATVAKVDVDAEGDLATRFGIRAIPTLLVFRHGQVVQTVVGIQSKASLLARLDAAA
jgi:thioredoxin 1